MSKQTAVEWLHYHLAYLMQTREWRSKNLHIEKFDELFIEALQMEREQIENAWHAGVSDSDDAKSYFNDHYRATSEKYYNKTYKGGEQ